MNPQLIDNIQFEDIDHNDCPDYCDAFISSADYNGVEMTEEQLEEINSYEYNDFKYEELLKHLY